jgi:hypothetical protein
MRGGTCSRRSAGCGPAVDPRGSPARAACRRPCFCCSTSGALGPRPFERGEAAPRRGGQPCSTDECCQPQLIIFEASVHGSIYIYIYTTCTRVQMALQLSMTKLGTVVHQQTSNNNGGNNTYLYCSIRSNRHNKRLGPCNLCSR